MLTTYNDVFLRRFLMEFLSSFFKQAVQQAF